LTVTIFVAAGEIILAVVDKSPQAESIPPPGVWLPAIFFAAAGLLDFGLTVFASSRPPDFDLAWTASGRTLLNVLLAYGLWRRLGLCRSIAVAYCLGTIAAYSIAILLAIAQQPLSYPPRIVIGSAFEVPLCVLIFRHLRSPEGAGLFSKPLF
jgi:hypothetical protein